ncbi:TlpA family protein disulfide reductase [Actinomadura coerulea]|uniref:TlpA family protein disulfide reductase n=1 Tax=Actinomadura coerulea TaxID=46159 RepID=UPI003440BC42
MPYLVAAVVLLGVLCLLNLLLTVGILRRMRADALRSAGRGDSLFALEPGAPVGEFTAVTVDGDPVTRRDVTGVVGFFSADCAACHDLLPSFVGRARELGRERVLAVVGGDDPATVAALAPVARVVLADLDGGPMARAFQNEWTPALYVVDEDGRIAATDTRIDRLPVPAGRG